MITPEQLAAIALAPPIFSGYLDPNVTAAGQFSATVSGRNQGGVGTAQKGATTGLWHILIPTYPGDGNVLIVVSPSPKTGGAGPIGFSIDNVGGGGGFDITTFDDSQGGSGSGLVKDTPISVSVFLRAS